MNLSWKLVLALVGIFVAGVVTGTFVTMRVGREMMAKRPMPEQWAPQRLKQLAERLELTPAQLEQLRPVMRSNMEELNRLRSYAMQGTRGILERMQRDIMEKLTPEQRAKYEQILREEREKREAREKADRARRPNGDRPGNGPRPMDDRRMREPGGKPGQRPASPPDKPPGT